MKVNELMNGRAMKSCSPDSNLKAVAHTMKAENIGSMPVTDKEKKVIGIVTDRDICLALSEDGTTSHARIPVSNIMHKKVHTVKETDDLNSALEKMRSNHIGRLPVVDESGKLTGILSLHHVIAKTLENKENFRNLSAVGESVVKTIEALGERYEKHTRAEKVASSAM